MKDTEQNHKTAQNCIVCLIFQEISPWRTRNSLNSSASKGVSQTYCLSHMERGKQKKERTYNLVVYRYTVLAQRTCLRFSQKKKGRRTHQRRHRTCQRSMPPFAPIHAMAIHASKLCSWRMVRRERSANPENGERDVSDGAKQKNGPTIGCLMQASRSVFYLTAHDHVLTWSTSCVFKPLSNVSSFS